ncbi:MAG: hypothetical protein GX880_09770 [Methanomicrobiales archaeon]|nr:hypothetical protein [Methanomicrobiales archaeon]
MELDRRFLILAGGEILAITAGNLLVALILQPIILAPLLDDRRGYPVFIVAAALYAAGVAIFGHILLSLIALAVVLVCGYAALTLHDYRLTLWAGGSA